MNDYLSHLVAKYKKKGIFIDSEILLLFIAGSENPGLIRKFRRTTKFDGNDFILVSEFVENFDIKVTSPHILTEVSDLLPKGDDFHTVLGEYVNLAEELFLPSEKVAKSDGFLKFGLADSAMMEISRN